MRISTAHSFESSIANLQKRQSDMAQSQMQLTSGKKVNAPSDDPIAAARAERALASMSRDDANQRSLDASRNVMQLSESSIGDAVSLLQTAREAMIAAGNGSYTDKERQALALKLKDVRAQMLTIANRSDGSGGFVFGGQGSASPPFLDTTSGVQFVGQGGQVQAASSESLNLTVDGEQTWLRAKSGNGVYETNPASTNTGSGWITAGTVTGPADVPYPAAPTATPPQYAVTFSVNAGVTTYSITKDGGGTTQTDVPFTSGKAIVVDGMSFAVTGQPADTDSFTLNQSTNDLSVFGALDSAIKSLDNGSLGNGQVMQAVNKGLSNLDSIIGNVSAARSAVGESLNRMDSIEGRISASKLAAETERSNAEDLDMVSAISKFQNQQTGYDAALKSYAMVQKLSLFQYING